MALTFAPRVGYGAWGRVIRAEHCVARPVGRLDAAMAFGGDGPPLVAYGCGRSYGDVALNPNGRLLDCQGLDRFIAFDRLTGVLTCEAGVTLADILRVVCQPQDDGAGWFLPVSPGTRYVSLGGAIANDVHGKNHHQFGTFGEHVLSLEIARSEGVIACDRSTNPDLFRATVGGLGLTGVILSASLQLRRAPGLGVESEDIRFGSLTDFFDLARESETTWEYTAAWIDCLAKGRALGRGIFSRARHRPGLPAWAPADAGRAALPEPPFSLANGLTLPVFNALYWRKLGLNPIKKNSGGYQGVLYPLDAVAGWNRLYGPRGFYQFQSVTPPGARDAVRELLATISKAGEGSMLTVLKSFGNRPAVGMLSFPMEGFTLALDFPNLGERTRTLLARLEAIVIEAGGRLYPAKDGLMSAESFRRGYPQLETFLPHIDPRLSSAFARRVGIQRDPAR